MQKTILLTVRSSFTPLRIIRQIKKKKKKLNVEEYTKRFSSVSLSFKLGDDE